MNKTDWSTIMVVLFMIFSCVATVYIVYEINVAEEKMDAIEDDLNQARNDHYNEKTIDFYSDVIYHQKQMEILTGENRSQEINYWQENFDNYEYVEVYISLPRLSIWVRTLASTTPIIIFSIFTFYLGKALGDFGKSEVGEND